LLLCIFVLLIITFLLCINFFIFYVLYQVANFSKACMETKCLNVDIGTFPFEITNNLPQQTTPYERLPLTRV
jgi:hypothetical protein